MIMEAHDPHGVQTEQTRLLAALAEGIALSGRFLGMLDTERVALADMDVTVLMRQVRAKEELLVGLQRLDQELGESMAELRRATEVGPAGLASLASLFQGDEARRFRTLCQEWAGLRQEIVAGNLVNQRFIQETLAFLGDAMSLFVDNGRRHEGYLAGGGVRKAVTGPCVLSREV
ncbi:MAG: hypothetical protein AUK28_06615 [Desulfobacterales bacterium CG2_30_60_27]|nr:MAG: hypothetical protein AUK28_06615 [Desulfobacterales bacterium CG2_30_60_27]